MSTSSNEGRIFGLRHPKPRLLRFMKTILAETPFPKLISLLIILWLLFSVILYLFERDAEGTSIKSFGDALYWGIAAFSTAGLASAPLNQSAQIIGSIWMVVGSIIFFGTIVATVTSYFNRPMKRPVKQIIDTIEYNLEQLQDLNEDELDLLKQTTNSLIDNIERLKKAS